MSMYHNFIAPIRSGVSTQNYDEPRQSLFAIRLSSDGYIVRDGENKTVSGYVCTDKSRN